MEKVEKNIRKIVAAVIAIIVLILAWLFIPPVLYPPTPSVGVGASTQAVFTVQNSVDDAFQTEPAGTWNTAGTTLRVYSSTTTTPTHSGILFYNVTLPSRSVINSAILSLYSCTTTFDDINATVYGHNVDNAPTFGSGENISVRIRTTASVDVQASDIGVGWFNITVTSIVQEIVERSGWQSGNNMSFLIIAKKNDATAKLFQCYSYDYGSLSPTLYVNYSAAVCLNAGVNTTLIGSLCEFHSFWEITAGLSGGIFSWNESGTWQNDTWKDPWDGTPTRGWFNVTKTLPFKIKTISYRFYVNDTSNNWIDSGIYTLTTQTVDYTELETLNVLSCDENTTNPDSWFFAVDASFKGTGWINVTFTPIWGRWLKLNDIFSYNIYTNELHAIEIQVKNSSGFWFTPTSVYDCCHYYYPPSNFIDGSTSTAWWCTVSERHWIILDLGDVYSVSGVSVYVGSGSLESQFNASIYVGYWSRWFGFGSSPWINDTDYPTNYIWTNNITGVIGNFTFQSTSLSTIEDVWLVVNYSISSTSGNLSVIFWNGAAFVEVGNLTVETANTWTVKNISLPRAFWSPIYVNQLKVQFKSYTSDTYMIDKAYVIVRGWTQLKMLWFLFDTMKMRQINSTFPLTREYREDIQSFTGLAWLDMSPILLYKLTGNTTYLEYAKEVADFLKTQPICRLFQTFDVSSQQWNSKVDVCSSSICLLQLAMLTSVDLTYASLLQQAVDNFTAIFFKEPYGRAINSYINGSQYADIVFMDTTAYASTALTYAGSVLNNATILNTAYRILINHTRGLTNIPWHGIYLNGTVHKDYNYAKEDETYGFYLLSLEFFYYQTGNSTIKDLIYDVAFASQYFYNSTYQWFNYRVDCDTGEVVWLGTVHGFGLIDEALVQAYLIFGNSSWLEWARNDYITNAICHLPWRSDGELIINDLIRHSLFTADADDSWNAPAKRVAIIFYNLNVSGFYHNQTWLDAYNKLYGSTSINHKGILGWGNPVNASSLTFWSGATDISLSTIFRNFQNYTDKTINSLTQLYTAFGNWLSGDVFSNPLPSNIGATILNSTHVEFSTLWTDFDGLSVAEFYWNVTGTWELNGTYTFDGNPTEAWSNFTRAYLGEWQIIYYYIVANDTLGNIGNTSIQTLTLWTSLSVGWNSFNAWSVDVGHTLGQVNASLNIDGINWTAVGIEYVNGSSVFLVYENGEYIGYDWATIESTNDKIWIYCLEAGEWHHTYL